MWKCGARMFWSTFFPKYKTNTAQKGASLICMRSPSVWYHSKAFENVLTSFFFCKYEQCCELHVHFFSSKTAADKFHACFQVSFTKPGKLHQACTKLVSSHDNVTSCRSTNQEISTNVQRKKNWIFNENNHYFSSVRLSDAVSIRATSYFYENRLHNLLICI